MNPVYAIMESPHRWFILVGIALLAGMLGAMMMLAYAWPHWYPRIWLIVGLLAAAALLVQGIRDRLGTTEPATRSGGETGALVSGSDRRR